MYVKSVEDSYLELNKKCKIRKGKQFETRRIISINSEDKINQRWTYSHYFIFICRMTDSSTDQVNYILGTFYKENLRTKFQQSILNSSRENKVTS